MNGNREANNENKNMRNRGKINEQNLKHRKCFRERETETETETERDRQTKKERDREKERYIHRLTLLKEETQRSINFRERTNWMFPKNVCTRKELCWYKYDQALVQRCVIGQLLV